MSATDVMHPKIFSILLRKEAKSFDQVNASKYELEEEREKPYEKKIPTYYMPTLLYVCQSS